MFLFKQDTVALMVLDGSIMYNEHMGSVLIKSQVQGGKIPVTYIFNGSKKKP